VTDTQYFQVAKKMIHEAKHSVQVMMFEMGYYDKYSNTLPICWSESSSVPEKGEQALRLYWK